MLLFLATRWTAKEAVYKAAYPRLRLTWSDVTLAHSSDGKPFLDIRKTDTKMALHLSISHDADYVAACVVMEES